MPKGKLKKSDKKVSKTNNKMITSYQEKTYKVVFNQSVNDGGKSFSAGAEYKLNEDEFLKYEKYTDCVNKKENGDCGC